MKKTQILKIFSIIAIIYSVFVMFWSQNDVFNAMDIPVHRILSTIVILAVSLVALECSNNIH